MNLLTLYWIIVAVIAGVAGVLGYMAHLYTHPLIAILTLVFLAVMVVVAAIVLWVWANRVADSFSKL